MMMDLGQVVSKMGTRTHDQLVAIYSDMPSLVYKATQLYLT